MHHFKFYRPTTSAVAGAVTLLFVLSDDDSVGTLPAGDPATVLDRFRAILPLLVEQPSLTAAACGVRPDGGPTT